MTDSITLSRRDKVILTALQFELVILICKLSSALRQADLLNKDKLSELQESTAELQTVHGSVLKIDSSILRDAIRLVTNDVEEILDDMIDIMTDSTAKA